MGLVDQGAFREYFGGISESVNTAVKSLAEFHNRAIANLLSQLIGFSAQ